MTRKAKEQLKKFGMEKEFQNWMKRVQLEPKQMQIGSRVRVVGSKRYGTQIFVYTQDGSEGVVTKYNTSDGFLVKFDKLIGEHCDVRNPEYTISKQYLELI